MDEFKIDDHKLIYHIPRLFHWYKGENIYPIYIEIGLHGSCNHRCIFCAFDFLNYKHNFLDKLQLERFLLEASGKGVKAILYSGEGEPLLHKASIDIISFTRKVGIDVALSTNGVMLSKIKSEGILHNLSWLRISLDAGTEEEYAHIHGTKKKDFRLVISNLKKAVKIRDANKYKCTIGAQFLLVGQDYKEILKLAFILRDTGVDYLVIKPYSHHPTSKNKVNCDLKCYDFSFLENVLNKISTNTFKILLRKKAIERLKENKPYSHCLGLPFAAHISASGEIYPCCAFVGDKFFSFGNIYYKSFEKIWEGEERKAIMDSMNSNWDISQCRKSCRLDEINRYLWELKNSPSHVNFI